MTDIYPPTVQRPAILALAAALGSASTALRRDENGDWRINGSSGHIYAVPGVLGHGGRPGFQMYCRRESKQAWTWAKKLLSFCVVPQDGDEEGCFFLDRLPTEAEAEVIRETIGVRKRPTLTPEESSVRTARIRGVLASKPASDDSPGVEEP